MRSSDRDYVDGMLSNIEYNNTFLARMRKRAVNTAFITAAIWALTAQVPGCHEDLVETVYEAKGGLERIAASYVVDDGEEQ